MIPSSWEEKAINYFILHKLKTEDMLGAQVKKSALELSRCFWYPIKTGNYNEKHFH